MFTIVCGSGTADELAWGKSGKAVSEEESCLVLRGFSCSETGGTAATAEIVIRHGMSDGAPMLVVPINFAADGYGYPTFFPVGMPVPDGLYLDRVSGETTVIFYVDLE